MLKRWLHLRAKSSFRFFSRAFVSHSVHARRFSYQNVNAMRAEWAIAVGMWNAEEQIRQIESWALVLRAVERTCFSMVLFPFVAAHCGN